MKTALITGISGQDGSYLSEILLEKGYSVVGIVRRNSTTLPHQISNLQNVIDHPNLKLAYGDLTDQNSIQRILTEHEPDEIYNLGAQSHVKVSFEVPEFTADVTGLGSLRLLESIRHTGLKTKLYQAGSSEMFGGMTKEPQHEPTRFHPRSPYGAAKVFAHHISVNYREAYDLFVSNGILFNHESPRRGENFVTRKITLGAVSIKLGLQKKLMLGNLEAKRDWGYAREYMEAVWLMLQQDHPDDFVLATGKTYSVRDFCELAFNSLGMDYRDYVGIDEKYFRPSEVDTLIGDPNKAREKLGWEAKTTLAELTDMMVKSDYDKIKKTL
ncbi:MAG: GDP-mannose 4,6-dehydratase [Alphaproteobacteria bacterium]|nr:GDP-mannose 4,6-dehydratase [Alphaproteobacteria bacterium]